MCDHTREWKHKQRVTTYHIMENLVDIVEAKCLASHAIAYQGLFTTAAWSTLCTYESTVWVFTFSENAPL